ncbi:putative nuclease HARBI1 [Rhagoletis pomonella]|uniref:putative nuclease HARBI1 n=1 Tax=Rhagoletis pomonella TaxID=28610 RepID=UPI001785CE12|nr:putative nuclease HARBI1 [Rhagoletis pomonella]
MTLMERRLCSKWIKLFMPEQEKRATKSYFYEQFGIPGVIGCIDGTHIKLLQPQDGSAFFNRKGNFSINAMIICDHNMVIRAIDACHPGSSHDSFIWSMSNARHTKNLEKGVLSH